MEALDREETERVRLRRLREQLKYCYTRSEFYKKKFDQAEFLIKDINICPKITGNPVSELGNKKRQDRFETPPFPSSNL